jgi:hypothetical protein
MSVRHPGDEEVQMHSVRQGGEEAEACVPLGHRIVDVADHLHLEPVVREHEPVQLEFLGDRCDIAQNGAN